MTATGLQLPVDLDFLQSIAVFGGIVGPGLSHVAGLLRRRELGPGQSVVTAGECAREMFIVEHGEVEVVAYRQPRGVVDPQPPPPPGTECELILAVHPRGACFGEMSLLDIQPRSATVRTRTQTSLLSLSYADMQTIQVRDMETFTLLVMNVAREVSRRLRVANRILVDVLLSLHDGYGVLSPSTADAALPLMMN